MHMILLQLPQDCFTEIVGHLCSDLCDVISAALVCKRITSMLTHTDCMTRIFHEASVANGIATDPGLLQLLRHFKNSQAVIRWMSQLRWRDQMTLMRSLKKQSDREIRELLGNKLLEHLQERPPSDTFCVLNELCNQDIVPNLWPSNVAESVASQFAFLSLLFSHPYRAIHISNALGFTLITNLIHPWIITFIIIYSLFRDCLPPAARPQLGFFAVMIASVIQYFRNRA